MRFILLLLMVTSLFGLDEAKVKKEIGHMLIVGFEDSHVDKDSKIIKQIQKYELGGVILFDRFYEDRNRTKNISSPKQLQALTSTLKKFAKKPLFIAVDQEGGKVARLKPKYGFIKIPSAYKVSQLPLKKAKSIYKKQAKMLHVNGINCDFAPVVDLAINPKNRVIVGLERSYSKDPSKVVQYASTCRDALRAEGVVSVLKHFPGHGSSVGDSHEGFVDVSDTWSEMELQPYKALIKADKADMIMTAHVYNKNLDKKYPATLSYSVNTKLLREKLGFKGVIVSDDMQMSAIAKLYSLEDAVTLAINSGVDMLLFGNQLKNQSVDTLIDVIYKQVKSGAIAYERIQEANRKIAILHTKRSIVQKPIRFQKERITMTKKYIAKHYGMAVEDIKIEPKMIVLHWTAMMSFHDSFDRLYPQKLLSDRKDISKASALNVSAHFLVDRDGTIYQLMPDNWMARHVIGLNYSAIGVENVGGKANKKEDLTPEQLQANVALVRYLKDKYPTIKYLIGHFEYRTFENSSLWLEKDKGYRTIKADPGKKFMKSVREHVKDLELSGAYE